METQFYFPIEFDYTLSKIKVDFEDLNKPGEVTSIETVMEERKVAEEKYEDAVASGDKVAVLT